MLVLLLYWVGVQKFKVDTIYSFESLSLTPMHDDGVVYLPVLAQYLDPTIFTSICQSMTHAIMWRPHKLKTLILKQSWGGGGNVKELQPWHVPQGKATRFKTLMLKHNRREIGISMIHINMQHLVTTLFHVHCVVELNTYSHNWTVQC